GGFIGRSLSGGYIENCGANVTVEGAENAGGYIGIAVGDVAEKLIKNCYATGKVQSTSTSASYAAAGGFVGGISEYSKFAIENSYSVVTASVLNTRRQSYMGGLIGDSRSGVSRVVNSYFDCDVLGIATPAEQGKTTEEMKNQGTYVNWDFDGVWSLRDGEYPKLRTLVENQLHQELVAPTNIIITVSPIAVKLLWDREELANKYVIKYNDTTAESDNNGALIQNLNPNSKYIVSIRAINNKGEKGPWSDEIEVITSSAEELTPKGVQVVETTKDTISLVWDEIVGVSEYEVMHGDKDKLTVKENSVVLRNLIPNTSYKIIVRAKTEKYVSSWSGEISVLTGDYVQALGTEEDPYLIYTAEQLMSVSEKPTACYKLMRNIDLLNNEFTPIGTQENPFTGIFDGNGYTIQNLSISLPDDNNIGLFGYIDKGTVKNLTINRVYIIGNDRVGALAGYVNGGTLADCSIKGVRDIVCKANNNNANQIIGYAEPGTAVTNCFIEDFRISEMLSTKKVKVEEKKDVLVNITAAHMSNDPTKIYTVTYNPEELQLTDFAAQTTVENIQVGNIEGTDINIVSNCDGVITFTINKNKYSSKSWTGVVTLIKFHSKITGESQLSFEQN
ncbi:fibronectin type III domain-containing protein, partial [Anaerotignum propionicum]|uniref:fibronectin type III domain-containing protein n=1 Tax=Anaerotignum propionicum TaxID=28446 RepID=UPI002ED40038|nr:hypothetical protein [Anaerotignum propionicum]